MKSVTAVVTFLLLGCTPDAPKLTAVRAAHWVQVVCGAPLSSMPQVLRGTEQVSSLQHIAKNHVDAVVRVSDADFIRLHRSLDKPLGGSSWGMPTNPDNGVPRHELCDLDLGAHTVHIEYWN
jgi:hypothetical protein